MNELVSFLSARGPELWFRLGEHILLTGASTVLAVLLGVPLGVLAARHPALRHFITGVVGILQTVPSLAMLALLLALLNRIGSTPAIIALVLYALLPIVRNTLTGLLQLPPAVLEAADGLGMTRRQRLWMVELPLATPVILTGIRTAAVVCVGIATLSAFIGAGGLGQFINRGLSLSNHSLILLGAVPSALLALAVDGSIGAVQHAFRRRPRRSAEHSGRRFLPAIAVSLPLLILTVGVLAVAQPNLFRPSVGGEEPSDGVVRVGSKNFTEQLVLGELMAQLIERETRLTVERRFDLGGTMICHQALLNGGIDLYAEYSGTGWTAVLGNETPADPEGVLDDVARAYRAGFDLHWLEPFGFNNTYAITVRRADAEARGWRAISDLRPAASDLRAGWTFEFSERPDGYPGLRAAYGLTFGEVRDLETTLMYQAVAKGEVDVICAFATDGRIEALDLVSLRDDQDFFPPYEAAPVVRGEALARHPELRDVLEMLAGELTTEVMRELNLQVDEGRKSARQAAADFLRNL